VALLLPPPLDWRITLRSSALHHRNDGKQKRRRRSPSRRLFRPNNPSRHRYSSAFSTQPGLAEKSKRGGEKMSTSWLPSQFIACEVWVEGGGSRRWRGPRSIRGRPRATARHPPSTASGGGGHRRPRGPGSIARNRRGDEGHLMDVPGPIVAVEIVHHEGGAAPDAAEAAGLRRHVERVGAHAEPRGGAGQGWNTGMLGWCSA